MKKILTTFILFSAFVISIKAASVTLSATCPATSNASSTISCTVKVTPSDFTLRGLQFNYSFSSGSYSSFSKDSGFKDYTINQNGVVLERNTYSSSTVTVGTLKAVMPASGSMTITFSNIVATDEATNSVDGSNLSKTIRVKSSVNTLSNLTINDGTLSPAFDSSVVSYTATVNATSVNIVANKTDDHSTVSGAGTKSLGYGSNTFKIVVTSETGAKKTYTIVITRPDNRESINTLSSLTVDGYSISPAFSKEVTSYKLTVSSVTTSVKINAIKEGDKSSFVSGYGSRKVDLKYGLNTVQIKVKSESDSIKVYTLNITRTDDRNKNNYLKSLTVNGDDIGFNKSTTSYALTYKNEVEKINIVATAEDEKSKTAGIGSKELKVGVNTFNIIVTAENGDTRKYILKVTRLDKSNTVSTNNNLKSLSIDNYAINFDPEITLYNITIEDETSLDFAFEAEEKTSSVIINGNENLKNGSVIVVAVTSSDGSKKDYKFNISKNETIDDIKEPKDNDVKTISNKKIIIYSSISIVSIVVIVFALRTIVAAILKRKAMKWK